MPSLFRSLLYLYPAAYRREYGEEMIGVLLEVRGEQRRKGLLALAATYFRETAGLLQGALHEHTRRILCPYGFSNFSPRRLTMRSEFRFPKSTVALMTIILLAVALTIDKAKSIEASVAPSSTYVGPIQAEHFTIVGTFLIVFVLACVMAAMVWAVLFALNRSGIQRLSQLNPSADSKPSGRS
jgi:hypothetical protein